MPYDAFLEAYDGTAIAKKGFVDDSKLIIIGIDFWYAASVGVNYSFEKTSVMFLNMGLYEKKIEATIELRKAKARLQAVA